MILAQSERLGGLAVTRTVAALRARVAAWRERGDRVALVPTMGALHAGHLALVARARECCPLVVASLFVNPTQFAPGRRFIALSARRGERMRQSSAAAGCDAALRARRCGNVSARALPTTVDPGPASAESWKVISGPAISPASPQSSPSCCSQAQPDVACLRREGLPATSGHSPPCARSRHARAHRGRADGARSRRPGAVLAQRLSFRPRSAASRRRCTARSPRSLSASAAMGGPAAAAEQAARMPPRLGFAKLDYLEFRDAETLAPVARRRPARAGCSPPPISAGRGSSTTCRCYPREFCLDAWAAVRLERARFGGRA